MRNLKRALSLALASIMVLGLMVVGASAASYEDFTDKGEIKNTEAVNTMVSLGVISGKSDGSYDPTGSLTRAEACTLIARMLGGGKDPVLGSNIKSNFKDTQGHWAETYIAYCANLGIIAGVGNGNFKPDDTLTGSAAAKMVLCALGYKPEFEGIGGANWELATNTLATKVKLYEGLDALNPSATISRDDVAQLIYNGVQANEVEYRNLQGDYSGTLYAQPVNGNNADSSMLAVRFGVLKVTGIAVANEKKSIDTSTYNITKDSEARVHVTSVSGYTTVPTALSSNPSFKVALSDSMLGQEVVLYVKFLNNLSPNAVNSTVLGTPILTNNNVVVETSSRLAETDDVKSALREAGIAMPTAGTAPAIQYTAGNVGTAASNGTQGTAGVTQRFIDNDGDGIVELIIQETPALAKVTAINTSGEKITFSSTIGVQDAADVVAYDGMAKGDYVLVVKYDDGKYHVTKAETVEAEVTAFTPGTVDSITAGGTKYVMGAGTNMASDLQTTFNNSLIGNTYTLYLDNSGNILAHKLVESAVSNYAVVLGGSASGNASMGYEAKVKVLLADGTEAVYTVDLSNTSVKLAGTAASASTSAKEAAIVDADSSDGVGAYFNVTGEVGTSLKNQLVGYTLDDNNVITLTDPHRVNDDYTTTTFTANQTLKKSVATYNSGAGAVVADDNTIFFLANTNKDTGAVESYSVVKGLSAMSTSGIDTHNTNAGQVVYYKPDDVNTKVAKAIWVTLDKTSYASSSNFVYISGGYTESLVGGTPIYTYPVVLEDGTVSTLSSKDTDGVKNSVMKYTLDSKGYATFEKVDETLTSSRVEYVNGNSVYLVNKDTNANYTGVVTTSNTKVWNVSDTKNIYSSELSVNDVVAIVLDSTDDTVKTAFVYDTMLGDMTASVGEALTKVSGSGTVVSNTSITGAVVGDVVKVTYTAAPTQKVSITIDGAGTDVKNPEDVVGTGALADRGNYTLVAGDIGKTLTITVKVTEDNKDTRTTTYTVNVAG